MPALCLRTKFLMAATGTTLLLGIAVIVLCETTIHQTLTDRFRDNAVSIAKHLAENAADHLLMQEKVLLQMMVKNHTDHDPEIGYIFIQDTGGKVLAHSFEDEFPAQLKDIPPFQPGDHHRIQPVRLGNVPVLDIAAPMKQGKIGVVHLGVLEDSVTESVKGVIVIMSWVLGSVFAFGIGLASLYAGRITAPLQDLARAAARVGMGNLDHEVPVRTQDELGQLGNSFNLMMRQLSESTVSREKFRVQNEFICNVVDSIPYPFYVVDAHNYSIMLANPAASPQGEAIGSTCHKLTHQSDTPCSGGDHFCPLMEVKKTGRAMTVEHTHYDQDGDPRHFEVYGCPILGADGEVAQMIEYSVDITGRKAAENALINSRVELAQEHEKLTSLFKELEIAKNEWEQTFDCIGDMVLLVDEQAKIKKYNRALHDLLRNPSEQVLNKKWTDLLADHHLSIGKVLKHGIEAHHKPTGRWFVINTYPFRSMVQYGAGTVVTIHDVTRLKKIGQELEEKAREISENRAKLQSALDQMVSALQTVTLEGRFDVRLPQARIPNCYEVMDCSKKECPCYGKQSIRCWQTSGTYCCGEVQGEFARKIGNCVECPVFKAATPDPVHQIGEHYNNMMHILDTKNNALLEAYSELKTTQATVLQQDKMASIGQLAAGVAHEINNPIGFITSNLGTLHKYVNKFIQLIQAQSEAVDSLDQGETAANLQEKRRQLKIDYIMDDVQELIEESLDGAERVKKIVQDLKSFSRVDEADCKFADINECLETTINIVWNELKYKTTLKKEYGKLPLTKCYPQQLNQVFMNILVNAAHAIEKQGDITIRTVQENGNIMVSISDTGSGIPEDKLSRIFDPFFTTKEIGKGTGLGLSITYDIVKKHQGEIKVRSQVGQGTTFDILIPIVEGRENG